MGFDIAQALASFQRTLVAGNSPYDRYVLRLDDSVLRDAARRGLELFRGKARCANCHEGPLFTDQKFHNTGVRWGREPLDLGRFEVTGRAEDKGRFKTPTLRQLTDTAPYMHDGSLKTLEAGIGAWFSDFAGRVRVQHEVHRRTGLTRSGGIRGASQSVVPRTESCHAINFPMDRRASDLRGDTRDGCLSEVAFGWRSANHSNKSRAWLADSFLTFLKASSTVLMVDTLSSKLAGSKPGLIRVLASCKQSVFRFQGRRM